LTWKLIKYAAAAALSIGAAVPAHAGSVTLPGETIGAATGAPAPPGLYYANTVHWGCRNTSPQQTCVGVDIPVVVWSTPWTIFGARLQPSFAPIVPVDVNIHHTAHLSGLFNSYAGVQLAWDLGHGWGFSYLLGGYTTSDQSIAYSSPSLNQRFALSYTADGWDLTANAIWGIQAHQVTDYPQVSPCPISPVSPHNGCNPNFLNVDLTATKRFGKWELGPVGFYSTDLSAPVPGYQKQSQFALGALWATISTGQLCKRTLQATCTRRITAAANFADRCASSFHLGILPLVHPRQPYLLHNEYAIDAPR